MKGNEAILKTLNALLADELTAVNQYMVHSEMCEAWGYGRLHEAIEKRAIVEMRHAESLIGRLIFLEGRPVVSQLNPIHIGGDVEAQLRSDLGAELDAVKAYNEAIQQIGDLGDNGTADLLTDILNQEEEHADWIEAQLAQVAQMGIQNYLLAQRE